MLQYLKGNVNRKCKLEWKFKENNSSRQLMWKMPLQMVVFYKIMI